LYTIVKQISDSVKLHLRDGRTDGR